MSLIRKPTEAERENSFRRSAEAAIAGARALHDTGRELGGKARRATGKIAAIYLLVMFSFGALFADGIGAKLLGMAILSPFWYLVLRKRNRADRSQPIAGGTHRLEGGKASESFEYRPGRNAAGAVVLGLFAILAGLSGLQPGAHFLLVVALLMGAGAVICGMHALGSGPALAFDRSALRIRTTFGGLQEVPWRSVHRIDVQVLTLRYMGIIPINRNEILSVKCDGGLFGARRLRLSLKALQLPPGGAAQLLAMLRQAQLEAVGAAGVAMAGAGPNGWGVSKPASGPVQPHFDPDAAIARHLAKREAERAQPVPLGDTAQPRHHPPAFGQQRPVFGRRTA